MAAADKRNIRIGTCGFPCSQQIYYRQFSCIEINITFYQLPGLGTAEKWRQAAAGANPDFEFIVKAWQLITHPVNPVTYRRLRERLDPAEHRGYGFFRDTPQVRLAWDRTQEFCQRLGARKVLFQTPPLFKPTPENLENMRTFFARVDRKKFIPIFEPRGRDWTPQAVRGICRECGLVHASDPLYAPSGYGAFRYFRLHGVHRGQKIDYDYSFSDGELKRILAMCDRSINYVMFNNSSMHQDALRFRRLTAVSSPQRPDKKLL